MDVRSSKADNFRVVGQPAVGQDVLVQDQHCDFTRGTSKRFRVMRNVGMAAAYFPEDEPVLCFGCGDGFEIEAWRLLGFDAVGVELSDIKRTVAAKRRLTVYKSMPSGIGANIYCAHTIEHLPYIKKTIKELWHICLSVMCLIFPIEPHGTRNPSHLSPIKSLDDIDVPGRILYKQSRFNDEPEGVIICKR